MMTLPFPKKTGFLKFSITFVAYFFFLNNLTGQIVDYPPELNLCNPVVILEKNHLNKINASQVVTIHNSTNHSYTIESPSSNYHIHISADGVITEEPFSTNSSYLHQLKKDVSTNPLIDNPIKIYLNDPSASDIRNKTNQEGTCFNTEPGKDNNPTDAKNDNPTQKDRVEERIYRMGYSKIIFRVFPYLKKTEITFVDERLSIIINEKKPGDDPENNPEKVAIYFDAIAVNPVAEIANTEDLIDNIDIPTLNNDAAEVRQALINNLVNSPSPDVAVNSLAATLNLLHPAKFADLDPIIFNNHSLLYSNICHHFDELYCCIKPECRLNIWGKAFGNFQSRGTDGFITGYNSTTAGIFVGLDCCPINHLCFGSGFAFTADDIRWKEEEADALAETFYGFLYSSLNCQRYFLQAIVSLSYSFIDGNRFIRISPELQRKTNHTNHALTYGGRLNGGLNFNLPCQLFLQVYDSFDLGNVDSGSFTEGGGVSLNLQVDKRSSLHLRNELGIQLSRTFISCGTVCWTPSIGVSWVYRNPLTGNDMTARFQGQSVQFTVNTRDKVTNQVSPQASLIVNSASGIYLSAYYDGQFGSGWNSNEVSIHMGKNF